MDQDLKSEIASQIKSLEITACELAECESDLKQSLAELADASAETKSLLRMWRDLQDESV